MRQQFYIIVNNWFLKIFIFILPIAYLPNISQHGLQMLIFNYGALIMFAVSFFIKKNESHVTNLFFPAVFLICIFVCMIKNPKAFSMPLLQLTFAMMLYKSVINSVENVRKVSKFFIYCVLINVFFMVLQLFGHDLVYVINKSLYWENHLLSHCGLMGRNYHLAFFIVMCLPLAFFINIFLGLGFVIVLIFLKSFAGFLGALVGVSLYYFKGFKLTERNIAICCFFIALFGLAAFKYNYSNLYLRLNIWQALGKEIFINPFIGIGLGMFDAVFWGKTINEVMIASSYNEYIKSIAELGFFPVLICLVALGKMIINFYDKAKNDKLAKALLCGALSLLIIIIFHEVFKFPRIIISAIIMLALCEVRINQLNKQEG